ncbi:LIM domain-binding protein 1 [Cricetulus griseus]|uniref:LIM domain-binding protein 1 n=1 Tax=Cricetulus griseus TaxID=10029 RepID=A0A061INQ2_CRIGR|nr:LIM domain-binding protein 1 [Cricetulus griseus]
MANGNGPDHLCLLAEVQKYFSSVDSNHSREYNLPPNNTLSTQKLRLLYRGGSHTNKSKVSCEEITSMYINVSTWKESPNSLPEHSQEQLTWSSNCRHTTTDMGTGTPCDLNGKVLKFDSTIGRTLIPRYFSTVFEGGVTDLYYILKHSKESYHNSSITVDCDQCAMVTQHGKPMFTKVCTEGRLILEFTFDDLMRIKTWHFTIRQYRELVPRSILAMHAQDPQVLDQLSKNITRMGLTNFTLNYLRLCVILEPMQELMSRHKTYNLSPRDCLKTCLFQKWQRMVAPPAEPTRQPTTKRRKRKNSTSSTSNSSAGNTTNSAGSKKKTPAASLSLSSQVPDVMVVGEPTLMGGEFGDEDERLITRLENTQYDAANGMDDEEDFNNSPALGNNSPWNSKPPATQETKSENPPPQASQ